jgi:hypothetical protein
VTGRFLAASVALTGFDEADLLGTGLLERYLAELVAVAGAPAVAAFLSAVEAAIAGGRELTPDVLAHPRFGPLARSVVSMWYLGSWQRLPEAWYVGGERSPLDVDRVISPAAYVEGLVWRAAGTHPPGAKQPGFGSWSFPPILEDPR